MDWIVGLIRGLFAAIDKIIVWLVETLYSLIFDISNVQIFSNGNLKEFEDRIIIILTIFMIFKLSFSFLTYIVNPDQFTDKSKGFSRLIQNIAVSLVLLVTYQFIFDKAMDLQKAIVNNNTIPKLIIGNNIEKDNAEKGKNVKNANILTFNLFSAFIVPNSELSKIESCSSWFIYSEEMTPYEKCGGDYGFGLYDDNLSKSVILGETPESQINIVVKNQRTYDVFDYLLSLKNGGIFAFDYKFIISTACGAFAALILLSFCFDVAVRSVKLSFLRLIAPIPIISYIDPIKGEGVFKKWLSNVGKTYADLFIRLIAIFFAIFIIQMVASSGFGIKDLDGNTINNPLVFIFILLGALMFAKQFPKLIQDITGINLDSKMQLNPFKKIREQALGGNAVMALGAGAIGGLGTATGNLINRGKNFSDNVARRKAEGKKFARSREIFGTLGSGLAGFTAGGLYSTRSAAKSKKVTSGISEGISKANTNRTQREISRSEGATARGIVMAKIDDKLGLETEGQRMKREVEESKDIVKTVDEIRKEGLSEISKNKTYRFRDANGVTHEKTYKEFGVANAKRAVVDSLKNTDLNQMIISNVQNYRNEKSVLENKASELRLKGSNLQAEMTDAKTCISSYGLNENDSFDENLFIKTLISSGNSEEQARKAADKVKGAYSKFNVSKREYEDVSNEYSRVDANLTANYSATEDDIKKKTIKDYTDDLQKAQKELKDAEDEAVKVLYKAVLDGEIDDAEVKAKAEELARKVKKMGTYDASTIEIFEGDDFKEIDDATKKIKSDAIMKENSKEYRKAQAEHIASGSGEGSYNNYNNPNATKR